MRVAVSFSLRTKSLLAAAGILVPLLAALNFVAWYFGLYPSLSGFVSERGGIPAAIDWGGLSAYAFWIENGIVSAVLLAIGLCVASVRASAAARRIVRLIDTAECFENGSFSVSLRAGRGKIGALENNMARLGGNLALMLKFINRSAVSLARKNKLSLVAESASVTAVVFRIANYRELARQFDPKRVNEFVNMFLLRVNPSITKTGGAVNKIWTIDDFYMLAVWGGSSSVPNLERNVIAALRTCVLVRSVVKTLNRDLNILGERSGHRPVPWLHVVMGVDSGDALVGPFGTDERKEYGVMGDVVANAVACIGVGTKNGEQIVLTEGTLALCERYFMTRELPGEDAVFFAVVKPLIGRS
jgi:class 3 adenylate cyclase